MSEHRPTVTLQIDIFPEDSFLLDEMSHPPVPYTAEQVAREAWNNIGEWWENGYMPIVTVTMPDGSEHTIDTEEAAKASLMEGTDYTEGAEHA